MLGGVPGLLEAGTSRSGKKWPQARSLLPSPAGVGTSLATHKWDLPLHGPPCPSGLGWNLPGSEESTTGVGSGSGVVVMQDKSLQNARGPHCLVQAENERPEDSFRAL